MKVSIIIPVYNTGREKLRRCLDSIVQQTLGDYECIMVDDGSRDESPLVMDEYAAKDHRFIAVHKENGGVSSARNEGLKRAKGEWLVFVDSDDYLAPDHLSLMMAAATEEVDMVMTGFDDIRNDGTWTHRYDRAVYVGTEGIRCLFSETDFLEHQIPWDRCYRNKPSLASFDERMALSEDRLFAYHYLMHCRGVAAIPQVTYMHDATDETSLTYRLYSSEVNRYKLGAFRKATEALKERYGEFGFLEEYMESCYSRLINSYRNERNMFAYHKARILHKLGLL